MKKLMMIALAATLATTACSKKTKSCEDIFEHTKSLMPAEFRDQIEQGKAQALEKCAQMSDKAKQCAADAKSLEDLQKCPQS